PTIASRRRVARSRTASAASAAGAISASPVVSAVLIGVLILGDQRHRRHNEDVEIQKDRPVLDIIEVVIDPLHDLVDRVSLPAPAIDLGPAGNARLDAMAGEIAFHSLVIELVVGLGLQWMRARPDDRQLAL